MIFLKKILKIHISPHIQVFPVVQSCPFDHLLIQFKSQRFDQMQDRAAGNACPSDISGIGRHLRLMQNNMQHDYLLSFSINVPSLFRASFSSSMEYA